MKMLITGGAGFIGSNFILYWLKKHAKDKIINLDKLTYAGNLENLKFIESHQNYKFIRGDICDNTLVDKIVKDADVIVHFAAESHVDRSILEPAPFIKTNILGTCVLLDAALRHKTKKFVHISTDEVFGSLKFSDKNKFHEQTPYNPTSPYSASKAASDLMVRSYGITYGLPFVITNCSNNFGPYQFPEKLIPLAITNILEDKPIPVYGDGKQIRDWLYVEDHCRALDLVINKGKIGDTYCIGGLTSEITNIAVINKIIQTLGKNQDAIKYVKDRPGHDRKYAVNWSKINKELGWKPLHDFETWLEKTIVWYQRNINWWKNIKSGIYKDYYRLQYSIK